MQISIETSTQVRVASGVINQSLEVASGSVLADVLTQLLQLHPTLASWIDASGLPKAGLLIFVNDETPHNLATTILHPHDQVSLVTLVSGG